MVSDEVLKDIKMIMTVMMRLTTTQTGQIPIGANINFLALKLARGDVMTPTTVSIGYNVTF